MITITKPPDYSIYMHQVTFKDKNGTSSLARTHTLKEALQFKKKYEKDLKNHILLKEHESYIK